MSRDRRNSYCPRCVVHFTGNLRFYSNKLKARPGTFSEYSVALDWKRSHTVKAIFLERRPYMSQHLSMKELRRRARITLSAPVMVTSLDTGVKYQAMCDTLDVSSNGALLRLRCSLPLDTRLRLDILHSSQVTEARVIRCERDGARAWKVGIQLLQQNGNFWGVKCPPNDWDGSRSGDDDHWYG